MKFSFAALSAYAVLVLASGDATAARPALRDVPEKKLPLSSKESSMTAVLSTLNATATDLAVFEETLKVELKKYKIEGEKLKESYNTPVDKFDAGDLSALHNHGGINFSGHWWGFRVHVHQPTLNQVIETGKDATGAVQGPQPYAFAIGLALNTLIKVKEEYISSVDKGNGIWYDLNWTEITFLCGSISNPVGYIGWALMKPVHAQ